MTLTQEEAHRLFEYKDGLLFYKKCPRGSGKFKTDPEAGTKSGHGYKKIRLNNKFYYTHQIIFLMQHGYIPKLIDHIDGNSENNAIDNLRESNKSLNACNAKLQSNNTSGTKGVVWGKRENKWIARVQINKKVIHLGTFKDLDLASLVADEARLLYHGKHARI
jgi:hypothetical protein